HDAVDRTPTEGVGPHAGENVGGRDGAAVAEEALGLDHPPVETVAGPVPLGEATVGVERPGTDLFAHRVPADALGLAGRRQPGDPQAELAEQILAVVRPAAGGVHDARVVLVDPLAGQPGESTDGAVAVVAAVGGGHLGPVADLGRQPGAAPPDVRR